MGFTALTVAAFAGERQVQPDATPFCLVDASLPLEKQIAYRNCWPAGTSAQDAVCENPEAPSSLVIVNTARFQQVPQTQAGACGVISTPLETPYEDGLGDSRLPKNWPPTQQQPGDSWGKSKHFNRRPISPLGLNENEKKTFIF